MSNGLLDMLTGLATPALTRQAASALGESESAVSKALGAAFPAILGQLAGSAGDSSLMGKIAGMIGEKAIGSVLGTGGGILSQAGSILGSGGSSSPLGSIGTMLLSTLFGDKIGGIAGALGSLAGLTKPSSAGSLLSLAGPMVLAVLGNKLGKGLTGAALGSLLSSEKSSIMSAVPPSFQSLLGGLPAAAAGAVGTAATAAARTATAAAAPAAAAAAKVAQAAAPAREAPRAAAPPVHHHEEARSSSFMPIALLLAVLGAGLIWFLSQMKPSEAPKPKAPEKAAAAAPAPAPAPAPKAVEAPKPAPAPAPAPAAAPAPAVKTSLLSKIVQGTGGVSKLTMPNGVTIDITDNGFETKLIKLIEDAGKPIDKGEWIDFDRLNFQTASANLTPESKSQVNALSEILKAFATAKVKVGGYTDNQGDPAKNLDLSASRAKRVMEELVALGIGADRVEAEGYGEAHAVADNSTPEGRAKNRRTALSLRSR